MEKKQILSAAMGITVTLGLAPLAGADPTAGNSIVITQSPPLTCQIFAEQITVEPKVYCQGGDGGFPGSPIDPMSAMHLHSAMVTGAGHLSYLDGNIGEGGDDFNPPTLTQGSIYHFQGWTVTPTRSSVTFTNDGTSHGMTISAGQNVKAF